MQTFSTRNIFAEFVIVVVHNIKNENICIVWLQEERYIEAMPLSKDEAVRVSGYYGSSSGAYYGVDDRELSSVSNSSSGSLHRRSSEPPDPDRG